MMFAVVIALSAPVAAAPSSPGTGGVVYVTAKEAFLDVGSDDGLTVGTQVKVLRKKRQVATCEVVEVVPDRGRCKSDKVSPGDRIAFPPAPKPAEAPKRRAPPPVDKRSLPDDVDVAELRQIVQQAPIPHTANKKYDDALPISTRAQVSLQEQIWSISTGDRNFGRTVLDASFRTSFGFFPAVPMFAAGDARVVSDLITPASPLGGRGRPGDAVELYVYGASVGVDGGPVIGEVGRFRPKKAPGVTLLDGAQVGARFGAVELGIYGGSVPDLLTTVPGLVYVTGGVYGGLDLEPAPGVIVLPRARAAVVTTPDQAASQGELEAETEVVLLGLAEMGAEVKVVTSPPPGFLPTIDGLRVDGSVTGLEPLRLSADYRYLSSPLLDFDSILGALGPVGASHHASATATYPVVSNVVVGAVTGFDYELGLDVLRGYFGPEVMLPAAFAQWGGLEVGYVEELGERAGRSAWVTARLTPVSALNLVVRASYFDESALGDSFREAGIMTLADYPVLPWLMVRGRLFFDQALPHAAGAAREAPSVIIADLGVTGSL